MMYVEIWQIFAIYVISNFVMLIMMDRAEPSCNPLRNQNLKKSTKIFLFIIYMLVLFPILFLFFSLGKLMVSIKTLTD